MSWKFVEIVESQKDIAGKLRVRVLCENDGVKESFFLKFTGNVSKDEIKSQIVDFIKSKNKPKPVSSYCPTCNQEII